MVIDRKELTISDCLPYTIMYKKSITVYSIEMSTGN